jgi:hypothetical protein
VPEVPPPAPAPSEDLVPSEPAPAPLEEMPEEPARSSKPADEVEDLFKDTNDKKPSALEPADAPAAEPAKSDEVDDLFKESDDKKGAALQETIPSPMATPTEKELDNLFADPAEEAAKSAAAEEPHPMRVWTDNTGKYSVTARLVVVGEHHVRLLKDTGRYTTVSFDRLSRADLAFVREHSTSAIASK